MHSGLCDHSLSSCLLQLRYQTNSHLVGIARSLALCVSLYMDAEARLRKGGAEGGWREVRVGAPELEPKCQRETGDTKEDYETANDEDEG